MSAFMHGSPSARYEIIHEMISRDNNLMNISWLCEIAQVSRSGYYTWVRQAGARAGQVAQDEADFALILEAYKFRGYDKGAKGIHMRLLHLHPPVVMNPKKIRRLMHQYGLKCPIRRANPYRKMGQALQSAKIAPNLLDRQFRTGGPRRVLLTDITYIQRDRRTEGGLAKFSYLSVIMDACTKEVLAWVLSYSLDVDFVLQTVYQLLERHGNELETDTLLHSDQGTHYTCHSFVELLQDSALRQSMSRKGNCWDNAPQESFFGHMKEELRLNPSDVHAVIRRKIGEWIDYYNNDRPQWNLRKLTPTEYYKFRQTDIYPLNIPIPTEKTSPQKRKKQLPAQPEANCEPLGGSAPEPPEFIALVSGEGSSPAEGKEKDGTV